MRAHKQLPFAHGGPVCEATFKHLPGDFVVVERLPFEADGEGPHWLIEVEKTDLNTLDLLDALSRHFGVSRRSMGYSGLKDRYAVTRQHVTVPAAGLSHEAVDRARGEQWVVRSVRAHRRKLRVGSHRLNHFDIVLRDLPDDPTLRDALVSTLERVGRRGVPNYFGPQRFGRNGDNLRKARQLFEGARRLPRQQHRFAISAARAAVFNSVLAQRVRDGSWDQLIEGEAVSLDGSASWFDSARLEDDGQTRLDAFDVHPSGPMWGGGAPPVTGEALHLERDAVVELNLYIKGLERVGLKQERRALRQRVRELDWHFDDATLCVSFSLNKGGFATAVLRELVSHPQLELWRLPGESQ